MLHAVGFLGLLRIIPMIHRAHQIPGDTADALKRRAREFIVEVRKFAVELDVEALEFAVVLFLQVIDVGLCFFRGCVARDLDAQCFPP